MKLSHTVRLASAPAVCPPMPSANTATDVTKTDSVYLTQSSVSMLQSAGQTTTPLWIQLRGHVSNPGASPITITSADSIHATLSVTVRVAVVHK
jgi:hypothetical protein